MPQQHLTPGPERFLPSRLSQVRLGPYLAAAGGSMPAALRLYRWNITASGAVYETLHTVEVVLRNAMHDQLAAWHAAEGRPGSWMDDTAGFLDGRACADIAAARRRAARKDSPTEGHVVAELSFGFWRFLLARRYADNLWRLALRHAFPHLRPHDRKRVEEPVTRLYQLRNRVAHLEPIYRRDLAVDRAAALTVVGFICPDTRDWMDEHCRIPVVAVSRPV